MDSVLQRLCHRGLAYLLIPLAAVRLLWRSRVDAGHRAYPAQRLGLDLPTVRGADGIWLHAVSAGEMAAAAPLLRALHERHPELPLTLTTSTPAGRLRAGQLLGDLPLTLMWLPWDLPGAVARALQHVRPRLLVLLETELWPGLIDAASQRGVCVVLADARLSARSAARYGRLQRWTAAMLSRVDLALCQSEAVARRLRDLGVPAGRLVVAGSMKLDQALPPAPPELHAAAAARWTLVAGSTHAGEEAALLDALAPLWADAPELLLVLAPRQHDRVAEVARLLDRSGLRWVRRSAGAVPDAGHRVLLLDTMGELAAVYGLAQLAFVGGSFSGDGGHSPIEPAAAGVPVCSGPSMINFQAIADRLVAAGGLQMLATPAALEELIRALRVDEVGRERRGAAARDLVVGATGALTITAAALSGLVAAAAAEGLGCGARPGPRR